MEIRFNKATPLQKVYKAGIVGNNLADKLIFTLDKTQDNGVLLGGYTPFLKMSEQPLKFNSYIDKDSNLKILSNDEGKLSLEYELQRKTTRSKAVNMQLQFEDLANPDNPVWQTEVFTVAFSDAVNAESHIEQANNAQIYNHGKRIQDLENYKNGLALKENTVAVIDLTDYTVKTDALTLNVPSPENIKKTILYAQLGDSGTRVFAEGEEYANIPFTTDVRKYKRITVQYRVNNANFSVDMDIMSIQERPDLGKNKIELICGKYIANLDATLKLTVLRKTSYAYNDSLRDCYIFEIDKLQEQTEIWALEIVADKCYETFTLGARLSIGLNESIPPISDLDEIKAEYTITQKLPEGAELEEVELNASLPPISLHLKKLEDFSVNVFTEVSGCRFQVAPFPLNSKMTFERADGIPTLNIEIVSEIMGIFGEMIGLNSITVRKLTLYKKL